MPVHGVPCHEAAAQVRDVDGGTQRWLSWSRQSQICSGVPFAVFQPSTSRHLLAPTFTSWRAVLTRQRWAGVLLQSYSWTLVPLAVPAAVTSRHLPRAWTLPSAASAQYCAGVLLQSYSWICVPLMLCRFCTSTHLPA